MYMKLSMQSLKFLFLVIFASNLACQDNQDKKERRNERDDKYNNMAVNEPVMVGGSYFICTVSNEIENQNEIVNTGCAIEDANGKIHLDRDYEVRIALILGKDQKVYPELSKADANSPWHWEFLANASLLLNSEIEIEILDPEFPVSLTKSKTKVQDPENILEKIINQDGLSDVQLELNLLNLELLSLDLSLAKLLSESEGLAAELKLLDLKILDVKGALDEISLLGNLIQIEKLGATLEGLLNLKSQLLDALQAKEAEIKELSARKSELEVKIQELSEKL